MKRKDPALLTKAPVYTAEEDAVILEMKGRRQGWPAIAAALPGRSGAGVASRYRALLAVAKIDRVPKAPMQAPTPVKTDDGFHVGLVRDAGYFRSLPAPRSRLPTYLALPQGGLRRLVEA